MADLADIAAQYNLTLHAFADDNQLYIHCKPENMQSAVTSIQQCVTAIEQRMAASRLRLNMDKTELIWTGTKGSSIKDVRKNIAKIDPPLPLVRFCPHQDTPPCGRPHTWQIDTC